MIAIDMEMPKSCGDCPIRLYVGGFQMESICNKTYTKCEKPFEKRNYDCPLKEIVTCKECEHSMEIAKASKGNELTTILVYRKFERGVSNNFFCAGE